MNLATTILGLSLTLQPAVGIGESQAPADVSPEQLEGVGIEEKIGAKLPAELSFRTHDGRAVTLGEVLAHDKPTILTFNYSDCPMLCSVQLNGLTDALRDMEWTLGRQYDVVTVSIDPDETPERAAESRERYLALYERQPAENAWPFLVADQATIRALTETVGFGYRLNEDNGEWLHVAALVLLSGDEQLSRYLYGVQHSPKTVQLSLAEASDGKQVSTLDAVVLYCFAYDPGSGSYTPVVANIMRLGGALTALIIFGFVLRTVLRSRRRKRGEPSSDSPDMHDSPSLGAREPDRSPST